MRKFILWWNSGDPAPGEVVFALLLLAVFVFIASVGR